MTPHSSRSAHRLRLAGLGILVAGLLASIFVEVAATRAPAQVEGSAIAAEPDVSVRELQQLERLGGKATVQTFRFDRWLSSLWHGERLAATLAVASIVVALLCLHLASLADEPEAG